MPSSDKNLRYNDILNRIATRRPFGSKPLDDKPQTPHDRALDLINAYDSLANLTSLSYPDILCYGPKALRRSAWSAVVIWHHQKGYHGYQLLELLGVWARYQEADILLTIGRRRLPIARQFMMRESIMSPFRLDSRSITRTTVARHPPPIQCCIAPSSIHAIACRIDRR